MNKQNCKIGKQFKMKEKFSGRKLISGFNIFSIVWWSKALSNTFKTIVVLALVFGLTFGMGYWRGVRNKPVILGYKNFTAYITRNGDEHKLEVKNGKLYFDDKMIKVSNIPQLRPYGIRVRPKMFFGVGSELDKEVGIGAEVAHYFKFNADVFGTNKGFYGGVSYDLDFEGWLENSSTGLAIGKSWDLEDTRFLWYWSIKF